MNRSLQNMPNDRVYVAPSMLASDFSRLHDEIRDVESAGADILHVDVMDGHFVPNLTIGPPVVRSIRRCSDLPYDVHLMIEEPERFATAFADAGADNITVHVELGEKMHDVIDQIHNCGASAGLCVKPATPASALTPYLEEIDLVLVMTVEPGFGGQEFMRDMVPKIREIRQMISTSQRNIHLEVDGGIDAYTAPETIAAGANVLVAGTYVFRGESSRGKAISKLRGGGPRA